MFVEYYNVHNTNECLLFKYVFEFISLFKQGIRNF
jgi:hypothetical protein